MSDAKNMAAEHQTDDRRHCGPSKFVGYNRMGCGLSLWASLPEAPTILSMSKELIWHHSVIPQGLLMQ